MTSVPTFSTIAVDLSDGIATVLLNRPEHRNAWTVVMLTEMGEAMRWADECDDVRAVVVSGAGDVFCVGADLSGPGIGHPDGEPHGEPVAVHETVLPSAVRKPVVAALNGHAVGIGITYALHCDLRLVAEDAKVGMPFVRRGLAPEANSSWLLPRVVGLPTALNLVLTGRLVSGTEAATLGLCHRALPAGEVLAEAMRWAATVIADGSPMALAAAKTLLWDGMSSSRSESMAQEVALFSRCAEGPDASEGVAAFLERRSPRWTQQLSADWPADRGTGR
jgi:enoyl-CoA hydratase/carnithine racemase